MNNYDKLVSLYTRYTPKVRIISHMLMWILFTLLLFFQYYLSLRFSVFEALFLSVRVLISSAAVFYLLFYLLFPITKKWRFTAASILLVPLCIVLWIVFNHACYEFAHLMNWDLSSLYVRLGLGAEYEPSFREVLEPKYILLNSLSVIYSLSPFFFTKIIFETLKMYIRSVRSEREFSRMEIEKINVEKQFLLMQLNPHFLFNALNNIYGLIITEDKNAANLLLNLSKIMEYTLYEFREEKVLLEKELNFVRNFFTTHKVRYADSTKLKLDIHVDLESQNLQIPPLLTFVFLENAFKYGLRDKKNGFVKIAIEVKDKFFLFSISNDFEEFTQHNSSSGIGLVNVKKRLDLLYKGRYQLDITDTDNIYKIFLKLDLNE